MATRPSVTNYKTGGANVYFAPWTGSTPPTLPDDYEHVGNCPSFSTDPKFRKLVHKSSMGATFEEDQSRIIEKSLSVRLTLDEINVDNLATFFGGTKEDEYTVNLMEESQKIFAVKLVSADDLGPQWTIELWKVEIYGSGAMKWIAMNQYSSLELAGDVLSDVANHPTNRFGIATLPNE